MDEEDGNKVTFLAIKGHWEREIQFSSQMNPQDSIHAPVKVLYTYTHRQCYVDWLGNNN